MAAPQTADAVPPLPQGFTLDDAPAAAPNASAATPPLPPGFSLDDNSPPTQSLGGAVQAAGSGLTAGIADIAGLPVDTARRVVELGKAAAGSAYGAATSQQATPSGETLSPDGRATLTSHGLYHYIDPNTGADTFSKSPPPAGAKPYTHVNVSIPSFLQPVTAPNDLGSSDSIKTGIRAALGNAAVDTQENTSFNRVLHAGGEAVPGAVAVPEAPIAAAASNFLGGATSQAVAENGGGPIAQTLAGLAAGSLPAAGTSLARLSTTGGAAGQAATQARIADAAASNTPLTAGQATGSGLLQKIEQTSARLWGGGPIKAIADAQTKNVGSHVDNIVENLAQGGDVSPTGAGSAINTGVNTTKQTMRAAEKAAYDKVDTLVPSQSPIDVSGTLAKLDELTAPTPGAANSTGALVSPKIASMRDNLKADIAANGGNPVLPYEAASALKTAVGNSIDWGFAPSDPVANGALKQVHGALKGDIDTGAGAISPQASQAVTDAKALYAANQARRDALNPIIDRAGGPEAVYAAATNGTKQGATKINQVMNAIGPQQQDLVRATVIDKLGRAIPSAQNAAGTAFDINTFLTNWSKIDPAAKDALFSASGTPGAAGNLRASLDSLTNTASTIKSSNVVKNPSGTGGAMGHALGLAGVLEGGVHALAGHPAALATAAGGIAANNILARAVTNPRVADWLAKSSKLPVYALPNAVHQLSLLAKNTNDPDARDLAAYIRQQQGE